MNEARPYASLSSGLLARKGSAKPAMRPQGFSGFEDLGWNDMGHGPAAEPSEDDAPEHVPSSIAALTPAPKLTRIAPDNGDGDNDADDHDGDGEGEVGVEGSFESAGPFANEDDLPSVAAQQRAIAGGLGATFDLPETSRAAIRAGSGEVVALPKRGKPFAGGRKAAFTLRLEADRHLRLRLACALTGRSAQQIVSDALDALLARIPEVETLASRANGKANGTKRN
jgi:hypothetical protein